MSIPPETVARPDPGNDTGTLERHGLRLLHDDILRVALEPESIDLIVTSPPYGVDVRYASYDDAVPYAQYLEFSRRWLGRCREFLKRDGRMCLNLPLDKNKGGQQSVYADVLRVAKEVGWRYFSTIIWNEQNISRRTAWGSWKSASAPYVIAPVEVIVLLYRERWERSSRGTSDISRDEFIEWTNGLWTFGGETRMRAHPAPFPVELPRRCLKLFSYVGDTVLDPFAGSGSTLLAALETSRKAIGVEISREYCRLAEERLLRALAPEEPSRRPAKKRTATPPVPRP
jgi:site-specific DNA-methyltransferase (adenine-specific)